MPGAAQSVSPTELTLQEPLRLALSPRQQHMPREGSNSPKVGWGADKLAQTSCGLSTGRLVWCVHAAAALIAGCWGFPASRWELAPSTQSWIQVHAILRH